MIDLSYSNNHYSAVGSVRHPHCGAYYFSKQRIITLTSGPFTFNIRQLMPECEIVINLCISKQQFSPRPITLFSRNGPVYNPSVVNFGYEPNGPTGATSVGEATEVATTGAAVTMRLGCA